MNNTINQPKEYSTQGIRFSYSGARWTFENAEHKFSLIQHLKGGHLVAEKIARQLSGALKRTRGDGLDTLARVAIDRLAGVRKIHSSIPNYFRAEDGLVPRA